MPPKAPVTTPSIAATTLGLGLEEDTSMANIDLQVVTMAYLKSFMEQTNNN